MDIVLGILIGIVIGIFGRPIILSTIMSVIDEIKGK